MEDDFFRRVCERAISRHARIGIGMDKGACHPDLISGLEAATEYADLVLVGDPGCGCGFDVIDSEDPASALVDLLAEGEIEGAVRGNVSASRAMRAVKERFQVKLRRLAFIGLDGWWFLFGPVGIDEGETISDRLELVLEGGAYLRRLGLDPKVSVLSGGRFEDLGRSERVDRTLAEGEFIAARARDRGMKAVHRGILIERCQGDDMVIAPEGVSGNMVFRTLLLLCKAQSLGAPVLMDRVFIDSSRARTDFIGPIMLASALVSLDEDRGDLDAD